MTLGAAMLSSVSPHWNTPAPFLELVREFAGGQIALDPCSNAGSIVDARRSYAAERGEDGLVQDWESLTFINPGYGSGIVNWVCKAAKESRFHAAEVVALLPARPDTRWFQDHVFGAAAAICFIRGRLRFIGAEASAPFPSAVAYYGTRPCRFERVFEAIGKVVRT